ncbi:hypothetical protein G8759_22705 [Spirosoma aureum]|uniref:DUF4595 domain-containing protein n=1 Tax=Spirosoma aureum TaxID=2692134 RepID=A0A6G9ARY0_9BACT|nr:hypothetical protein [Spirosoma aureum]QIP15231.1 hypothetical protein G8759_22705 [Spirosoma aureum]
MKQFLLTALFSVLTLGLFNCKKTDVDAPAQTVTGCKLTQLDRGNGNKHIYEYNAAGYISQMTIHFQGATGTGKKEVYVYSFTYNSDNQITGASITVDGQKPTQITDWGVGDAVSFKWNNGKLTQVLDQLGSKTILTTTVSYDDQGRIVRLKAEPVPEWGDPFEKEFVYDAQGNFKSNYYEGGDLIQYEAITIDPATKSAESLQAAHGLPYDIFNVNPWRANTSQQIDGYELDKAGKFALAYTVKTTNLVKNSANVATSQTFDDNGKQRIMTFTLADCQ